MGRVVTTACMMYTTTLHYYTRSTDAYRYVVTAPWMDTPPIVLLAGDAVDITYHCTGVLHGVSL
jgi:hypothetical protein